MRTFAYAIAASLLLVAVLVPTASAFTYCTSTGLTTPRCSEHLVCIGGGNYGSSRERCQYGIGRPDDPCTWINCWPGPVLP